MKGHMGRNALDPQGILEGCVCLCLSVSETDVARGVPDLPCIMLRVQRGHHALWYQDCLCQAMC